MPESSNGRCDPLMQGHGHNLSASFQGGCVFVPLCVARHFCLVLLCLLFILVSCHHRSSAARTLAKGRATPAAALGHLERPGLATVSVISWLLVFFQPSSREALRGDAACHSVDEAVTGMAHWCCSRAACPTFCGRGSYGTMARQWGASSFAFTQCLLSTRYSPQLFAAALNLGSG
jgi:hypothetical protein